MLGGEVYVRRRASVVHAIVKKYMEASIYTYTCIVCVCVCKCVCVCVCVCVCAYI
jgi:hypothetical protein